MKQAVVDARQRINLTLESAGEQERETERENSVHQRRTRRVGRRAVTERADRVPIRIRRQQLQQQLSRMKEQFVKTLREQSTSELNPVAANS